MPLIFVEKNIIKRTGAVAYPGRGLWNGREGAQHITLKIHGPFI
jgi:hypothetical protein